jgi:hypothetical protein
MSYSTCILVQLALTFTVTVAFARDHQQAPLGVSIARALLPESDEPKGVSVITVTVTVTVTVTITVRE